MVLGQKLVWYVFEKFKIYFLSVLVVLCVEIGDFSSAFNFWILGVVLCGRSLQG